MGSVWGLATLCRSYQILKEFFLQVSSDSGVMLVAPFAGGKTGLMRELKKLYNASGGIKVKVKRGSSVIEVRAKVAVDESSLLKKTYVLASATDSSHIATLVDAMEQDCLLLQGAHRNFSCFGIVIDFLSDISIVKACILQFSFFCS